MSVNTNQQIFGLAMLAAVIPLTYIFMNRAKKGKVPKIERLPALDGIDRVIDECAKVGKPIYVEMSSGSSLTGEYYHMLAAALSMLPTIARRCARLGVRLLTIYHAPQAQPMIRGILTQAAKAEGKDESYFPDRDIIYQSGGDMIGAFFGMAEVETNDCRGSICLGRVALQALSQIEANKQRGCISIQGTSFMNQIHVVGLLPEYTLIGEELYAASASISGDTDTLSTLQINDLIKMLTLALVPIFIVAIKLGIKL